MRFFIPVLLITLLTACFSARADEFYVSCKSDNSAFSDWGPRGSNDSIVKITHASVSIFATGKAAFLGFAVDRFGNLYVANPGDNNILKYARANGTLSGTPAIFASGLNALQDIAFDPSGNLYEIEASGNINKFVFSGATLSNKPLPFIDGSPQHANLTGTRSPINLAFDQRGNLYVAILIGGILKFTNSPSGLSNMPDDQPFSTISRARQMAFDKDGNLFTANHMDGRLYEFHNTASGLSDTPTIFATGHGLNAPTGVAFDSLGNLYITNWGFGSGSDILKYPNINGVLSSMPTTFATGLASPPILIVAIPMGREQIMAARINEAAAFFYRLITEGLTSLTSLLLVLFNLGIIVFLCAFILLRVFHVYHRHKRMSDKYEEIFSGLIKIIDCRRRVDIDMSNTINNQALREDCRKLFLLAQAAQVYFGKDVNQVLEKLKHTPETTTLQSDALRALIKFYEDLFDELVVKARTDLRPDLWRFIKEFIVTFIWG